MPTTYGENAEITGSLAVDGNANLGNGDDDITLDRTSVFVDASEDKVGIGTITPDYKLDVAGDIILDADGADVSFRDGGTGHLSISNSSNDAVITSLQTDKDMIFKGVDGGSTITALTLDMSDSGKAIFNKDIQLNNSGVISNGSVNLSFPTVGGAISTEGFSIALATALG